MSVSEKINLLLSQKNAEPTTAVKRLETLFDEGSFSELGGFNNGVGVAVGYGTIDNRLVYAYSQDGVVNLRHAAKIAEVYKNAVKTGAPVVAILNSQGVDLNDGIDIFEAYGILFSNQMQAKGLVPQISVVLGDCLGIGSIKPMISDFVIMKNKDAKIFMSSPKTFSEFEAKSTDYAGLGGAKSLSESSLLVDLCFDDEEACLKGARELISLLPSNYVDTAVIDVTDELNRESEFLDSIISDDENAEIDVKAIIKDIADNHTFMELKESFAKEIVTGFIKINGVTTGVIANNGLLSLDAAQKAVQFVNFCSEFNIQILTLTDILGYAENVSDVQHGLFRGSAELMTAFKNADVPKVNVILRNANGSTYLIMNSKHTGADIVYAWPTATISLMQKKAALNIMGQSSAEYDESTSPYLAAAKGYVDDIIIPAATRKRVIAAFEMLASKNTAFEL